MEVVGVSSLSTTAGGKYACHDQHSVVRHVNKELKNAFRHVVRYLRSRTLTVRTAKSHANAMHVVKAVLGFNGAAVSKALGPVMAVSLAV